MAANAAIHGTGRKYGADSKRRTNKDYRMTDATTTETTDTKAFAPFEWMLALRYLRARRKEGFISVIAGFSFLGILLGVATLIIVMAVMNGFRNQLFEKILGLNGHAVAYKLASVGPFDDYDDLAKRLAKIPGVKSAVPLIEGQVMISSPSNALGGLVRGMTEAGIGTLPLVVNSKASMTRTASPSAPGWHSH
jgi:lipoprotein-releasing system permease protein